MSQRNERNALIMLSFTDSLATCLKGLLEEIDVKFDGDIPPEDFCGTFYYALSVAAKSSHAEMVVDYYLHGCTLKEIGEKNEISSERVRQILNKVLRILRKPQFNELLSKGLNGYMTDMLRKKTYQAKDKSFHQGYEQAVYDSKSIIERKIDSLSKIGVEYAELPTRAFNLLYKSGYRSIGDIIAAGPEKIANIPNLGFATYTALVKSLVGKFGEERDDWLPWSKYKKK